MPISKMEYGTAGSAITITLASLANNAARASTKVDNTTNLHLDANVMVGIKTGASGVSSTGYVNVYAYGTVAAGASNYHTGGATGTDAAHAVNDPTNLMFLGVINANANATTYVGGPMSVARAFGGVLPAYWGIVIENKTGAALDATEGSHVKIYQGTQIKS